jgi:hypothetical protein
MYFFGIAKVQQYYEIAKKFVDLWDYFLAGKFFLNHKGPKKLK